MKKEISVLFIANSYGQDVVQFMPQIAEELGVRLTIVNMFIGGCEVWKHIKNLKEDNPAYDYEYYDYEEHTWKVKHEYHLKDAITERNWDYISLQQASHESCIKDGLWQVNELIDLVTGLMTSKETKLLWHMTWSYPYFSWSPVFKELFDSHQVDMYNAVVENVKLRIVNNPRIYKVIPSGTTLQNLKQFLSDHVIYRDFLHVSYKIGRYAIALDAIKNIAGVNIDDVTFCPFESKEVQAICKKCADAATDKPFEVSVSPD